MGISLAVKQIANRCCPSCDAYIATYTAGIAGQLYQEIEEESGEEFWSIKAWSPPPRRRKKAPDVLVVCGDKARFIIEVKWGAVAGSWVTETDLNRQEWKKTERLLRNPTECRVRGPAVKDGLRYRSQESPVQRSYFTDSDTKPIVVTEFGRMKRVLETKYWEVLC